MPTLICYDIGANALRARIARKLLETGLERINRSVFLGDVKDADLRRLGDWLELAMGKAEPDDSLIVLPLTQHQVWQMEVLGKNELDIPSLSGKQHTLIL